MDLTRTPFAGFAPLGGSAESIGDARPRLYRSFRMPEGHRIILSEHDMSADGSRSWRDPADEPGCPNEVPPKPFRIGANGVPVEAPVPQVITRTEVDAMFGGSKRRCKQAGRPAPMDDRPYSS